MAQFTKGAVLKVRVERVVDGDTVRVRRGGLRGWLFPGPSVAVRLYGMDAPEQKQRYGVQSTKALRKMLRGGGYSMEVMDVDRYDRVVGLLYRGSRDKSVNYAMVKQGWAHAYVRYGGRELGFDQAESDARKRNLGIWKGRGPGERPESWRCQQRVGNRRRSRLWLALLLGMLLVLILAGYWWFSPAF